MKLLTALFLFISISASSQIGLQQILSFSAYFGQPVPDIQPDFYGYYQNISGGFDSFGNLSNIQGDENDPRLSEFTYTWQFKACETCKPYWEGQGFEIPFNQIWNEKDGTPCEGSFWVTLVATHSDLARFELTKPVYAFWGGVDYPNCDYGLGQFDHFNYPLQPFYTPYQYQVGYSYWDANRNNVRDTADLQRLLSLYGQ